MRHERIAPPAIEGFVARGFEGVRDAFAENFATRGELGDADPDSRIGYGYVTDQMGTGLTGDPRDVALRRALPECVRAAA